MTDFAYRPLTVDDAPQITAILNARDRVFLGAGNHWESTVCQNLEGAGFDLAASSRGAFATDGSLAGFEVVYDHINPMRADLWGYVSDDWQGRGVGTALLQWATGRAAGNIVKCPPEAQVSAAGWAYAQDEAGRRLFTDNGYSYLRSFYTMRLDYSGEPMPAVLPDGFRLVSFAENPDLRTFIDVDSRAFQDHWGWVDTPLEEAVLRWQETIENAPDFDPNTWWLAFHGDQPAGVIMTQTECSLGENIAWVNSLGVLPQFRRMGLGAALLAHAIAAYHARGSRAIALGVDASSLTNAVELYKRAGMSVYLQRDIHEKVLREGFDLSRH